MFFHEFLDQYYGIIAVIVFFFSYTSFLVYTNLTEQYLEGEDYAFTFIIVALLSTLWLFVIPFILVVLIVIFYIKGVNWISQVYIKRSKDT